MNYEICSEQLQYQKNVLSFRRKQPSMISIFYGFLFIYLFIYCLFFYSFFILFSQPLNIAENGSIFNVAGFLHPPLKCVCFVACKKQFALIDSHTWLFCFGAKYLKTLEKHLWSNPFQLKLQDYKSCLTYRKL